MNIAKNMEAVFIAAVVLAGAASMAVAAVPSISVAEATTVKTYTTVAAKAGAPAMQVVTITAKRLSAAEKAALAK
ncbi:hypothetical protein LJR289_005153 [Pseudoduganella sp. LjRoot289]|uniref:hypothetical protein n=1 Tax=Pseudoduganella sp. LjRoot289 TaxID=3342314 RepID=UPI003ED04D31